MALGCKRKPAPQAQGWASNHGVATPAVTATPIPLEEPVATLRVPNSGFPCAVDDYATVDCDLRALGLFNKAGSELGLQPTLGANVAF
jgi:hypothetical protein